MTTAMTVISITSNRSVHTVLLCPFSMSLFADHSYWGSLLVKNISTDDGVNWFGCNSHTIITSPVAGPMMPSGYTSRVRWFYQCAFASLHGVCLVIPPFSFLFFFFFLTSLRLVALVIHALLVHCFADELTVALRILKTPVPLHVATCGHCRAFTCVDLLVIVRSIHISLRSGVLSGPLRTF